MVKAEPDFHQVGLLDLLTRHFRAPCCEIPVLTIKLFSERIPTQDLCKLQAVEPFLLRLSPFPSTESGTDSNPPPGTLFLAKLRMLDFGTPRVRR